jgi:hypothetical protein
MIYGDVHMKTKQRTIQNNADSRKSKIALGCTLASAILVMIALSIIKNVQTNNVNSYADAVRRVDQHAIV